MATKKRSKPRFEVPAEIASPKQAGWVYRSEAEPVPAKAPTPPADTHKDKDKGDIDKGKDTSTGKDTSKSKDAHKDKGKDKEKESTGVVLVHAGAVVIVSSLAALSQAFLLGTRVFVLPLTVLRRFTK